MLCSRSRAAYRIVTRPLVARPAQLVDELGVRDELVAVARAKAGEARRDVVEPLAQLVAGGQLTRPPVQARALARDPPRPHMVDQDAVSILGVEWVVDPLGTNVARCLGLCFADAGGSVE